MLENKTKASARTRMAISKFPGTFSEIIGESEGPLLRLSLSVSIWTYFNGECMVLSFRSHMVHLEALEGLRVHATQKEI